MTDTLVQRHAEPDELRTLPTQYRMLTLELDREALAARAEGDTRIPITISSEEPCDRWYGVEILGHKKSEVDLTRAADGLAFCLEHDTDNQVGLVEDMKVGTDGRTHGMVRFGNHPDASWVQKDMESGIRKYISVGYMVTAMVLTETKDGLDTYRITGWTPLEVSTVAVPADPTVGVGRSADRAAFPVSLTIPVPQPPLAGAQERTMPEPLVETPKAPTIEEIRAAEVTRSSSILTLCSEHDIPLAQAQEIIGRGISPDQAAGEILRLKRAAVVKPKAAAIVGLHDRSEDKPFASMGDFFRAVAVSQLMNEIDPRLRAARQQVVDEQRALGQSVGVQSDGGFAVAPEYSNELLKNVWDQGEILKRLNKRPMSSNSMKINSIEENSRANGSRFGGVQTYWASEAAAITATKIKLRQLELSLNKLFGLGYVTDEMLQDAPFLQAELSDAFNLELMFKIEDAVINGVGAGTPLGILNSGAVVQVAIEGGQTIANSPASLAINTAKMLARMPASLQSGAVWLINQDVLPYLVVMTLGGTAAAQPVFIPGGNVAGAPFGSLWGKPIVPVEYCATFGTPGDIILTALSQYIMADRGGPIAAQSMHVAFLTDEMAFRITYRLDGQPRWVQPITPYKGANTLSPYITLGQRV